MSEDLLVISDTHLGQDKPEIVERNNRAHTAFFEYGARYNAQPVLNGDVVEDLYKQMGFTTEQRTSDQCEQFTERLDWSKRRTGKKASVIPGNHDPVIDPNLLGGDELVDTSPGLVCLPNSYNELLITHGQVAGAIEKLRSLIRMLMDGEGDPEAILKEINDPNGIVHALSQEDKTSTVYCLMRALRGGRIARWLETTGVDLLQKGLDLYERIRPERRMPFHRLTASQTHATCAYLAHGFGRRLVLLGHTHSPGIYKHMVIDPVTGSEHPVVVANSGHFTGRDMPRNALHIQQDVGMVHLLEHRNNGSVEIKDSMNYREVA